MTQGSDQRIRRTVAFDRDVMEWLRRRGKQMDRSVEWQVRRFLRAAMVADEQSDDREVA